MDAIPIYTTIYRKQSTATTPPFPESPHHHHPTPPPRGQGRTGQGKAGPSRAEQSMVVQRERERDWCRYRALDVWTTVAREPSLVWMATWRHGDSVKTCQAFAICS